MCCIKDVLYVGNKCINFMTCLFSVSTWCYFKIRHLSRDANIKRALKIIYIQDIYFLNQENKRFYLEFLKTQIKNCQKFLIKNFIAKFKIMEYAFLSFLCA